MFKALKGHGWKRVAVLSTGILVGLVGTVILAGPAGAHTTMMNTPTTACDSSTGTYTVTYTGQGDYNLKSTVTVVSGSVTPSGTTVTPNAVTDIAPIKVGNGYSDPFTFVQTGVPGTATSASISVTEVWSDGYKVTASATASHLAGTCTQTSVATAPTFTDDVCSGYSPAGATYTIPAKTGVIYEIDGKAVAAGTYPATDGSSVTITAVAAPGYSLTGTASWSHTFGSVPTCTTSTEPTAPTFTDDVCSGFAPAGATYTIPAKTGVIYEINGKAVAAGTYPATDGSTVTITAVPAEGYTLTGTTTFTHTFASVPTCTTSAVVSDPKFTDDVCNGNATVGASYTIPASTGVVYKVNGSTVNAGTYSTTDGSTVTVTATAAAGYTLTGTSTFTHTFAKVPTCTASLAFTGTSTPVTIAVGAGLLGVGALFLMAAGLGRRRTI